MTPHMLLVSRCYEVWAHDCTLYGTDVCAAFWEYLYLRRQAMRLVTQARARGTTVTLRQSWTWIWTSTLHTLGDRR